MNTTPEQKIPLPLFLKGKVREVYDLKEHLLIVSSDRISAYDFILPNPIPDKGKILNQISVFWFSQTSTIVKNHLVSDNPKDYPESLKSIQSLLDKRSMLVLKTDKFPIECVVRGYLSGSGWKEYQQSGKICGIPLPKGLQESQKLLEPIFTPATKEEGGKHDENISFDQMAVRIGLEMSEKLKNISIALFNYASKILDSKGLILADTKFEFGTLNINGKKEIILIDEALTPDSSRFWERSQHQLGVSPPSFDKQFVRNYLDSIQWNRKPPVPTLPEDIILKTREKYLEAYTRISGKPL